MGKLKTFSGKEICRILEDHGFVEIRQRGSHIIMQRRIKGTTITVPVPNHKEVKIGKLSQSLGSRNCREKHLKYE